jgi:hypothetical protein
MKFMPGQLVVVLDSENKAAGTGTVISSKYGGIYDVEFNYKNSDKKEVVTLPEHRLLLANEEADQET